MAGLVKAAIDLDVTIIPRGGGTGYTGGAVPLDARSGGDQYRKIDSNSAGRKMARQHDDARGRYDSDRRRRGDASRG